MKRILYSLGILGWTLGMAQATPILLTTPDMGALVKTNAPTVAEIATNLAATNHHFQELLDMAERQRHEKVPATSIRILVGLLQGDAPPEFKRQALINLALATQDNNEFVKAQQIFAQYRSLYPEDLSIPEVLLREGLLYRQMGVNTLAISKFYAVMSTALKLKLDDVNYYKALVLEAQTEIAETHYLEGQFDLAAACFTRILKLENPTIDREPLDFKLIRSLAYLTNHAETIVRAQRFLQDYPVCGDVPEVRFILASAYKGVGRNQDAMKQVLLLMQSQEENVAKMPETWVYWQRRAGNEIANQLFNEGDYLDALQIYQCLVNLDPSLSWQAPVWYQIGLVYEQLQQWQKATDTYSELTGRQKELTSTNNPPSLAALYDMAKWRKNYIVWMEQAHADNHEFQRSPLRKLEPPTAQ